MTLKKYMLIDIIFFAILLALTEGSQLLKVHLDSKIFISFSFLILGMMIIRWRGHGLLAASACYVLITPILGFLLEVAIWKMLLVKLIPVLLMTVLLPLLDYLENKTYNMSLDRKVIFYITLFIVYCFGESIGYFLTENKNIVLASAEFIYTESLSLFVTLVAIILLANHEDLLVNQRKELGCRYEKK